MTAVAEKTTQLPNKPGIYHGLSFLDYQRIDAVNQSLLGLFDRSPAHARYAMLHPDESTPEQSLGTATHAAILEPERFATQWVIAPKIDKRTNAGKEAWARFQSENGGREWIDAESYGFAKGMADAVYGHHILRDALTGPGQNEVTVLWVDPVTGLLCKARIDRFCKVAGFSSVLDLKSTRDAQPCAFAKSVYTYGYHRQAAFYLDGLDELSGKTYPRKHFIAAVESSPPHGVVLYELDTDAIVEGRAKYRRALDLYAECRKSNSWPGYPHGIQDLHLPRWAIEETNVL